jgi:hypothetical protein
VGEGPPPEKGRDLQIIKIREEKSRCLRGERFLNKNFEFDISLPLYAFCDELYSPLNNGLVPPLKKEYVYFYTARDLGFILWAE